MLKSKLALAEQKNKKEQQKDNLSTKQKKIIDMMRMKASRKNAKGMRYNNEFLLDSVLLKIKSPKGFRHCRKHGLLPLPSERHLRRLLQGMTCSYGLNREALAALRQCFQEEKDGNKAVGVLIFDEVKLREEVAFNSNGLKVNGFVDFGDITPEQYKSTLANHALVFMFVPLLHSWIQPVAIYASRNATPGELIVKILLQVIIQLERTGAKIIGFT